jgi:nucleoside-diphosphate-sugar epimerase
VTHAEGVQGDAGPNAIPALPGARVLVTGASGFIGSHVAERLLAQGGTLRLLVRRPERVAAMAAAGAEIHTGDLTAPASLGGCCEGIDVVFHAAAWIGTPYARAAAWQANVDGTRAVMAEARRAGVRRFVHLSSIAVYGPIRTGVVTETRALGGAVELYGESKIAAEDAARDAAGDDVELVVTRPGMVYGPRSRAWTVRLIRWIADGRPAMVAGGHGYARPIFIENLVDALVLCATVPEAAGQAFTLIDENMRWRDYLHHYAQMVGRRPRSVSYAVSWLIALTDETRALMTRRPPRIRRAALGYAVSHAVLSTDQAHRVLGWRPRYSMADAMAITRAWLVATNQLPQRSPTTTGRS